MKGVKMRQLCQGSGVDKSLLRKKVNKKFTKCRKSQAYWSKWHYRELWDIGGYFGISAGNLSANSLGMVL
ncbi:MAG: hypothetical protein ACXVCD_19165, partial [Pseudobdellovibrionaceae bacterium]